MLVWWYSFSCLCVEKPHYYIIGSNYGHTFSLLAQSYYFKRSAASSASTIRARLRVSFHYSLLAPYHCLRGTQPLQPALFRARLSAYILRIGSDFQQYLELGLLLFVIRARLIQTLVSQK